jgi:hypothetical protein
METPAPSPTAVVAAPSPNPHVLSRQLVGLLLWVGLLSLLGGIYTFIVCLTLAILTFADAWKSGIYKKSDKRGFLNISPMAWGIAMAFLFVVAFPVYILRRSELRTISATNGFYWALVIVGAALIIAFVGNLSLWM